MRQGAGTAVEEQRLGPEPRKAKEASVDECVAECAEAAQGRQEQRVTPEREPGNQAGDGAATRRSWPVQAEQDQRRELRGQIGIFGLRRQRLVAPLEMADEYVDLFPRVATGCRRSFNRP